MGLKPVGHKKTHGAAFVSLHKKIKKMTHAYSHAMSYYRWLNSGGNRAWGEDVTEDEIWMFLQGEKNGIMTGILAMFESGLTAKEKDILGQIMINISPEKENKISEFILAAAETYSEWGYPFTFKGFALQFYRRDAECANGYRQDDLILEYSEDMPDRVCAILTIKDSGWPMFWPYQQ